MAGLGRGFESLIPTEFVDDDFDVTAKEDKKASNLTEVPITGGAGKSASDYSYFGSARAIRDLNY